MEDSGQIDTKSRFSWGYPWFWLETTVLDPTSNLRLITCTSLFGGWLADHRGLENPLYKIFEGVTQQQIEILTSVAIASITTAAVTFIGGYIALRFLEWNPIAYIAANIVYFAAVFAALGLVSVLADASAARAILITVGWTLLSLSTLGFSVTIPILLSKIVGSDPVTASIKCIINKLLGIVISTRILKALGASISGFLFYLYNFILRIIALGWGYSRI